MKLLVFRTVYLHTKNELPVNYETVWSRTTRVGRACTYAQKFRNELFTKFILYFSWKWESLENSSCAKKWLTGELWNDSISVNSRRKILYIRSKVLPSLFTEVKLCFSWEMIIPKVPFAHKNELPGNDETVWSQSTRVDRPRAYAQEFNN